MWASTKYGAHSAPVRFGTKVFREASGVPTLAAIGWTDMQPHGLISNRYTAAPGVAITHTCSS
jgi:hypothetical protein